MFLVVFTISTHNLKKNAKHNAVSTYDMGSDYTPFLLFEDPGMKLLHFEQVF